jgi:myxalamid-type polyketide synthase MxaE and MxaD
MPSRWWGDFYDPDPFAPGKSVSRWGSFLDSVDGIDYRFFGISPREARSIDPQHRLLLEVAWESLEDAGLTVAGAAGSRAGVYVGIMLNDYGRLYRGDLNAIDGYTAQNNTFAYAANRISFYFDLHGPSMAIDANCCGSLLAFHQACRSVLTGESEWALAGGVSLILAPDTDISMSKVTALSPTGRIRTWDAKADGYVRGEGAGLVVIKPLASALAAGDRIYSLVLGTAANHKGRGNWIVEPSTAAQKEVILAACEMASVKPEQLDYIELHGTGTPKGDPIEAEAVGALMTDRPADRPCRVGSIKTNIGHLDSAAGIVGLIKAALCIHHRELVPSLHFETCNPAIDLDRLKLRVQTAREPWPEHDGPPMAGVTSIAFGGTSVHAILAGSDPPARTTAGRQTHFILPLSAKSDEALSALAEQYASWLDGDDESRLDVLDVCLTVSARRTHHTHRLAVIGDSASTIANKIRDWTKGDREGVAAGNVQGEKLPRIVFVFPGQGPQWVGMARDLIDAQPAFTDAIAECDSVIRPMMGWSVIDALSAGLDPQRLDEPSTVQPVLFSCEVALAALWRSWGISPDVVIGHSFGEIAAAVAASALTIRQGARVVCARGRVTQKRAGRGGVAVVDLSLQEVESLLRQYQTLEVGGVITATTTIVTGGNEDLEALLLALEAREVFARRVKAGYASHGRDMDPVLDEFGDLIGPLDGRPTPIRFCSTVDGRFIDGAELGTQYWVRNLRYPVRFADAVRCVGAAQESIFLEIGPHPVLTTAVQENLKAFENLLAVLSTLQRGRPSMPALDDTLSRLYALGCDPDWAARYRTGRVVSTPTYPWQRERMWLEFRPASRIEERGQAVHPLLGQSVETSDPNTLIWEQTLGGEETAYFQDHCIQNIASVSTSAMVEMIVVAASRTLGTEALEIRDLELLRAFVLPQGGAYRVQTILRGGPEWTAEVRGCEEAQDGTWRTHATARVGLASSPPAVASFKAPLADRLSRADAYAELATLGIQYGAAFQGIEWLSREGEGVFACVRMPSGLDPAPYFFHPALHDAAHHVAVLGEACRGHSGFLPVRIRRIWIGTRPESVLRSHAHVTRTGDSVLADIRIENVDGEAVEILEGVQLVHLDDAILGSDRGELSAEEAAWLYSLEWAELDVGLQAVTAESAEQSVSPSDAWLILADTRGVGSALAERIRASGCETFLLTRDAIIGSADNRLSVGDALGSHLAHVVDSLQPTTRNFTGVIHLWSLDLPEIEGSEPDAVDAAILHGCESAVRLTRVLEQAASASPTPVWFVTRGAQEWDLTSVPSAIAPLQAPLWGLARAIASEVPSRWGGLVDLDPRATAVDCAAQLWDWLRAPRGDEDEVVFRQGRTFGGRLVRRAGNRSPQPVEFQPDATYLVTGGTGGLGLSVARWLATRGAKHLVLAARTPVPSRETWSNVSPSSPHAETVSALRVIEQLGAEVKCVSLDIADHRALIEFLNKHERHSGPDIRGVFHLAGIARVEDTLSLEPQGLIDAVRAKVHGTLALHRWLDHLDMFVLFSSASSVIRSPRLASYAAGNAFLDSMAHYRRARGLPALAINWGLWNEVGLIRSVTERGPGAIRGMKSMNPEAGIRILERLVESDDVQTMVWPPDWNQWVQLYPSFARTSLIANLIRSNTSTQPVAARSTIRSVLSGVPEEDRRSLIRETVTREIAARLRIPIDALPTDVPLEQLGFDSLQATELQVRLRAELGVRVPVLRFLGFSTVSTIAQEVVGRTEAEYRSACDPPELQKSNRDSALGKAEALALLDGLDALPEAALDEVLKRLGT